MPTSYLNTSTSGDNLLVAAPGSKQIIRLHSFVITSGGAVVTYFKSGSTVISANNYSTNVESGGTAAFQPIGNGSFVDCRPGEALYINLSTTGPLGITYTYSVAGPTS